MDIHLYPFVLSIANVGYQASTLDIVEDDEEEPSVRRGGRWDQADELALLKLVLQHRKAWAEITISFKNFQHRRPSETEESLRTKYKNMMAKKSKYSKPFKRKEFEVKEKDKRKSQKEIEVLRAWHNEDENAKEATFTQVPFPCTSLSNASSLVWSPQSYSVCFYCPLDEFFVSHDSFLYGRQMMICYQWFQNSTSHWQGFISLVLF